MQTASVAVMLMLMDDAVFKHTKKAVQQADLGGGFKDFLFSPLFGEDSHFD